MKYNKKVAGVCMLAMASLLFACTSDDNYTIPLESAKVLIPSDDQAGRNPTIGNKTTEIPNPSYEVTTLEGEPVVRINVNGIQDAGGGWMRLYGTGDPNQNVWVSIDGTPKGTYVVNNSDNDGSTTVANVDIAFLIDNSGSMQTESDAIARDIVSWSNTLASSGLAARFAVVGYGYANESGVNGGIDFTDVNNLSAFLNYSSGTRRTVHWGGANASTLQSKAPNYRPSNAECGVAALRFAEDNYSFRQNASRVYVNFTDDSNHPGGNSEFSVKWVQNNWQTNHGTIHTVYSAKSVDNKEEDPRDMSKATGGTILNVNSDFSGVTLNSLPVTGSLQNTYSIYFADIDKYVDGKPHLVKITVLSKDNTVQSEKEFYALFER